METKVIYTEEFEKDVKKFLKKFPTLAEISNPTMGANLKQQQNGRF